MRAPPLRRNAMGLPLSAMDWRRRSTAFAVAVVTLMVTRATLRVMNVTLRVMSVTLRVMSATLRVMSMRVRDNRAKVQACRFFFVILHSVMQDFKRAFRLSLPVLGAYWFLGVTYGLLAASMGYAVWYPMAMALVVFSGSVEFIALTMLLGAFHPLSALAMALMVGARHLFYGITLLDRWRGAGWRKPLLIFMMSDETFAVNYANGGSFQQQLWLSLLNYLYWVVGAVVGFALGTTAGDLLLSHLQGLQFVVTAMFVSIFMDDYLRRPEGRPAAWLGVGTAALCLWLFGSDRFIVPTMLAILTILYIRYRRDE